MCGIAGIGGSAASDALVAKVTSTLTHRGPDDGATRYWSDHSVGLGHRRLSIIDLSPAGRNPLANEDQTVWIVYNGEIYNHEDLRGELEHLGHRFRSSSDTEVVVHAYEEWGDEHVRRLRGMFAYALYDRRPGAGSAGYRLLLVRDRLGIKPLYYYWKEGLFAFASEAKALLAIPGLDLTPDRSALFDYLTYGYVPTPKSAWRHIRKAEAAHVLTFDGETVQKSKYWDPLNASLDVPSDPVSWLRDLLEQAVTSSLVSDVDVGVFLSGGIDSSTVTAFLPRTADAFPSFSIGFDVAERSETAYARLIAEQFGTKHHERVVGADSVEEMSLDVVSRMYDEPFADGSAVPTSILARAARERVKVAVSGDGGDEVFGGYTWYRAWLRRRRLDGLPTTVRTRLVPLLGRLPLLRDHTWFEEVSLQPVEGYGRFMELFSPAEKRSLVSPEMAREFNDYDDYWHLRRNWREDIDPMTRLQLLDLKTYLPDDILTKVDRASMSVGLEVRPPLLDHRLVEAVLCLPSSVRLPAGEPKGLLKSAMRSILPDAILDRPKHGFSAPWNAWSERFGEWGQGILDGGAAVQGGILRGAPTVTGRKHGAKLWALLLLDRWVRGT